jgi:putative endonuclease
MTGGKSSDPAARSAEPATADRQRERRRRYRRGHWAELLAVAMLTSKGYRVLGRRVVTASGEIDLIAVRGQRLAFVEVKRRATRAAAEASVGDQQRRRVRRAADLWLAGHGRYRQHDVCFDLVFVLPWRWPEHLENAL